MGRSGETRERILIAAEEVVRRDGVAHLTLEAAATEAGLSKGGVLYHFPTRDELVTGMVRRLSERFTSELTEAGRAESGIGARTRAYVRATFGPNAGERETDEEARLGAAVIAALAAEPELLSPFRDAFDAWQHDLVDDGLDSARATIVRLAADGLWLTELFGLAPLSPRLRRRVERELLDLTRPSPS